MSILDFELGFSKEQDIGTGSASATFVSTNTVDIEAQINDLGATVSGNLGQSGCKLNVFVDGEAIVNSGSSAGVLSIKVMTKASTSSLASGTVLGTVAAVVTPGNADGAVLFQGEMPRNVSYLQYVYLAYVTTTKQTAGKVRAWLGLDAETQVAYK